MHVEKRINLCPRQYASQFYRDSQTASWINRRKDSGAQRMVMEQTRTIKEMRTKARGGNYADKRRGRTGNSRAMFYHSLGIT